MKQYQKRSCRQCSKEFQPRNATQVFCSRKCRSVWKRLDKEKKRNSTRSISQCLKCDKDYSMKFPHQLFCSEDCRGEWHKWKKRVEKLEKES
jgi:predicted nucleic acid-binding Zn ribbon protein